MICPVCKKEKYITPGCSKCRECLKDAVKEWLSKDPQLKHAFHEALHEMKSDIPRIANDAANLFHAVSDMQRRV